MARHKTKCRYCPLVFEADAFTISQTDARLQKLDKRVTEHVQRHHPAILNAAIYACFETEDPGLQLIVQDSRGILNSNTCPSAAPTPPRFPAV